MEKTIKKPIKLPAVLSCLGRAVEVCCDDIVYRWPAKDNVLLYASKSGRRLYCVKTKKKATSGAQWAQAVTKRRKQVDQAVALYEKWHEYDAITGSLMVPPRGFMFKVGRATHIIYASDKWTGRMQKYIHEFKTPPVCWVNRKNNPTVLELTGGKIRVRKAGITG